MPDNRTRLPAPSVSPAERDLFREQARRLGADDTYVMRTLVRLFLDGKVAVPPPVLADADRSRQVARAGELVRQQRQSVSAAARELGVTRQVVYRLVEQYDALPTAAAVTA